LNSDFKRLTFMDSVWHFFNGLIAPFLVIYFNDFGGLNEIGISIAIKYLIQGMLPFLIIKIFKKKSKNKMKNFLLFGQILESLRIILFIFARNINDIYLIQLLGGITYSFISPSYNQIFVKVCDDESNNAFMKNTGITNLMIGLSALISGFFINYFGFVPVFIAWSVIELIYGFYFYYLI
jgi:hypothetical protein